MYVDMFTGIGNVQDGSEGADLKAAVEGTKHWFISTPQRLSRITRLMAYSDRTYVGMGPGLGPIQCQTIGPVKFPHII